MAFLRQSCVSRATTNIAAYSNSGCIVAVGNSIMAGCCSSTMIRLGRSYHSCKAFSSCWSSTAVQARLFAKEQRKHLYQQTSLRRTKASLAAITSTPNNDEDPGKHLLHPNHRFNHHRRLHLQQSPKALHWSHQRTWSLAPRAGQPKILPQLLQRPPGSPLVIPPTSLGYSTTATTGDNVTGNRVAEHFRPVPSNPKRDPLDVSFNNPIAAFKSKTTLELVRAYAVYMICSSEKLVEHNMAVSRLFANIFLFLSLVVE